MPVGEREKLYKFALSKNEIDLTQYTEKTCKYFIGYGG